MRAMAEESRPIDFTTYREVDNRVKRMFAVDWDVLSQESKAKYDAVEPIDEIQAQQRLQKEEENRKQKKETKSEAYIRIKMEKEKKQLKSIKKEMKLAVKCKQQSTIKSFFNKVK